jgi:hypothetical protein
MNAKTILLTFTIVIVAGSGYANEPSPTMPAKMLSHPTGFEPLPDVDYYPADGALLLTCDTVGTTWYEYQSNGSSGDRIVYHEDGTIHVCWMKLLNWPYPGSPRYVYYNWRDQNGTWSGETAVSEGSPSGYCQMSNIYNDRAAIAYHSDGGSDPTYVTLAVEWDPPGYGFFDYYDPPDQLYPFDEDSPGRLYWPYIAVDRDSNIHIVASENTERRLQRMAYTRSEDGGLTWINLQLIDTVMVISSVLDASPVSDKVVLAYCAPYDTTSQWRNDIVYYEADNGTDWDWRYGMNNVTDYANDNDSMWAYTDCDILIDYNDVIHIVWNAQRINQDNEIYYRTYLFHYDDESDEITEITHHPESDWYNISGAWNRPICKMSLGAYDSGTLNNPVAVTWTQFDTTDVSVVGFGNGDIYAAISPDGGQQWSEAVDLTDTHSPNCYPGECLSEHWSCLADVMTDTTIDGLHLTYILDRDAGSVISDPPEGSATENYVVYLNLEPTAVPESENKPIYLRLDQNYPNPFNARTTISFTLHEPSRTTLEIFDIRGSRVATLIDRDMSAGDHTVIWDASRRASGIYFYRLTTDQKSETRQAVLIK